MKLKHYNNDDPAFLFRLNHIIAGAIRYARPKQAHIVKVDNWFGSRWRCFAGSLSGRDLHPEDQLALPPFAPKRVLSETSYRRYGDQLKRCDAKRLHDTKIIPSVAMPFYLDEKMPSCVFIWYSGNTANQDRGTLMVYEVEKGENQRAWYAELQKRDGIWSVSSAIGTSVNEICALETSYNNRLAPLSLHRMSDSDQQPEKDSLLWQQALDATYGSEVASAAVLIEQYQSRHPENPQIRLLYAINLGDRRLFESAEKEFLAIERLKSSDKWREVWLKEWADFNSLRRREATAEEAYREYARLKKNDTAPWIFLGACLALQGKLEEAEVAHRHATQLRGDTEEAYLNLGLVLRAMGRLPEAVSAFESALALCPDYQEVVEALADVNSAIELQNNM